METPVPAGYVEIEHTADWAIRAWGPTLEDLFAQSALGMYMLTGAQSSGPATERLLRVEGGDPESLLVGFLGELLYLTEQEGLTFDAFEVCIEAGVLQAVAHGAPIGKMSKIIKAVTFHNLKIRQTGHGYEVEIVFDV